MLSTEPIALCLAGHISPPVMLARMVLAGASSATIGDALAAYPGAAHLAMFHARHTASLDAMVAMLARVDHASATTVAGIAAQFDAAVAAAPEASVATYSLGDPNLLDQATSELVTWLRDRRLFVDGMDVLDFGCGFGRVATALAPHARSVRGLDVSPAMIAEARRRYGNRASLEFSVSGGQDLADIASASCDLLLAVDSFPYLFQAGVAEAHFGEAARVLRPGRALVVLNLSYADDHARAAAWATHAGLGTGLQNARPFEMWDGQAFVWTRNKSNDRSTAVPGEAGPSARPGEEGRLTPQCQNQRN